MDNELSQAIKIELDRISKNVSAGLNAGKTRDEQLQAQLFELQQRAARRGGASDAGIGSTGSGELRAAIENATGLDDLRNGQRGRAYIDLPAGFFAPRAALTGDGLGQVDRPTTITGLPQQRITVRSLLPVVETTAASIAWLVETGSPAPAEVVTEGAAKPETSLGLELKTGPIVTIAFWMKASTQILSDIPGLTNFIDLRLRYGLALVEEAQLLKGSGVGNNLRGLYTAATAFSDLRTGATLTDMLRRAIADLEVSGFMPNGIVLHPEDFAEVELVKDGEDRYLIGAPRGANPSSLWTVPVVRSPSMSTGTYLIGDFMQAGQIFDRWQPRVEIAATNEDDWTRNLVTIRAEERLALAVHQPSAMRKGSFS